MAKNNDIYYLNTNVYVEAKKRIEWLFDEFETVVVSSSWWKDSSVALYLTLEVAREKWRLPLHVLFIDQEAEWSETVEYHRRLFDNKDIVLHWYQIPLRIFNATSHDKKDEWLFCWDVNKPEEWIREKEPEAITENTYWTDRFADLFDGIISKDFPGKTANIGWVRAEESPRRRAGLTQAQTYKHITYGKKLKWDAYTFYPLYDWTWRDVWKYIHDNDIKYNKIYDYQYQYGVPFRNMRVSNLHHETAVKNLFYLPEVDVDLYNKLQNRLNGINTAVNMQHDFDVKNLPFMFNTWREYRDFLLDKLIWWEFHETFKKEFERHDLLMSRVENIDPDYEAKLEKVCKSHIHAIIVNDFYCTTLKNTESGYIQKVLFDNKQTNSHLKGRL